METQEFDQYVEDHARDSKESGNMHRSYRAGIVTCAEMQSAVTELSKLNFKEKLVLILLGLLLSIGFLFILVSIVGNVLN